jgi:hypothetical protein
MEFARLAPKALLLVLTTFFLVATCLAQDVAPPPPVVTVLQGKVVDRRTGRAVVDAFVEWKHGDRTQNSWTGAYGAYAFVIPVQDRDDDGARADHGEFVVSIRANLYLGAKANVQVHSGKTSVLNFALMPKPADQIGVLSGHVTNAKSGQDMGGVSISIVNAGAVLSTLTNSDGTYTISDVGFSGGLVLDVIPGPISAPSETEDEGTRSTPCFALIERPFEMVSPALEENFTLNLISEPYLPPNIACPTNTAPPNTLPPTGAPGAGGLADDPSIQWQQADVSEIAINADADAWHAGHVNDVLVLNGGAGLVVGADSGGVWTITPKGGQATPLSDTWGSVNITALAFGSDGPTDIYAGTFRTPSNLWSTASPGGVLFETDTSTLLPLFNWLPVQGASSLTPLPMPVTPCRDINRILVINEVRRIVLACDNGIWWSPIPSAPSAQGVYLWKQAMPDAALSANNPLQGNFSGIAKGPGWSTGVPGTPPGEGTIVASINGGATPGDLIYYGGWSNGDLVFHSASVESPGPPEALSVSIGRTDVASCLIDPATMFAVGADGNNDQMAAVWESSDGGRNWPLVSLPPKPGGQGSYNNTIAVNSDCSTVAVGWHDTFVSSDHGGAWTLLAITQDNGLHEDIHALTFDPHDPTTLYIGSDGGVASVSGIVPPADANTTPTFLSNYNRQLYDLQLRHMAASPTFNGLVAGALQDNGNIYAPLPGPWQFVSSGDGDNVAFVSPPALTPGSDILALTGHAGSTPTGLWNSVGSSPSGDIDYQQAMVIPLGPSLPPPPPPDGLLGGPVAVVKFPRFSLLAGPNAGEKMYAVAAYQGLVYGLFAHDDGTGLNWVTLGCLGGGYHVYALSSYDGFSIFLGTDNGDILEMDSPYACGEPVKLLTINPPPNVQIDTTLGGCQNYCIPAIVEVLPGVMFASLQWGGGSGNDYVLVWREQGAHAQSWDVVGGGLPNDLPFTTLEAPSLGSLFAATGRRVYVTHDLGNSWMLASDGLPMVHFGTDLHFVLQPDGTQYLYLATFGRSLWRAVLP